MIVVHRFHIEPTKEQEQKLFQTLALCRRLYNAALKQREICYRQRGKPPSCTVQKNELPALKKELPEYKQVNAQVLQDCLQRLDNAFERFFGGLAGYPHYKDQVHYRSFTYPQADKQDHFKKPGYIYLPKIGYVKMKAHFEFDSGKVNRINVKYHNGKWYVNLTSEIQEAEAVEIVNKVGIDVGLLTFAVLSDGTKIDNPKYFHKSERKLARLQRQFSRKKKGSNNREKAKAKVTRLHDKIANQRKDFLHKTSYGIVQKYDLIAVEGLSVKNMIKNHHLSKSIADAGWGKFISYLEYKCLKYGKKFVKVPPGGTSQTCICGAHVPKDLSIRVHNCPECGLIADRDVVSAMVILQRAS
ncbi:MAG: IS200/IS605 family element transposase accessory protein TnpB [Syntrophothermus sp.]|uniref:RNA-guided endonuclease InsQ/TnpB family protein n=1 Tax=Syntrophothermus sp. TaxID=2736299 RepID=UPI002579575C|nr:RNA-guided endonuclease TnpB family protein [Syntrophothermus sp.]NSW82778.1 IS200/IS605 family element transposase accessory protein TnpB [Syntrophothermus sp.]